jgi:uncharacterized protein DUF5753
MATSTAEQELGEAIDGLDSASVWYGYNIAVISGIAQTRDYARAVLVAAGFNYGDPLEQRLAWRLDLQDKILRSSAKIELIIHEGVLKIRIGGPSVAIMVQQLKQLLELSARPGFTIRVVPFEAGEFQLFFEPYDLIDLGTDRSTLVYLESLAADRCITDRPTLQKYFWAFGGAESAALSPEDSRKLIHREKDRLEQS